MLSGKILVHVLACRAYMANMILGMQCSETRPVSLILVHTPVGPFFYYRTVAVGWCGNSGEMWGILAIGAVTAHGDNLLTCLVAMFPRRSEVDQSMPGTLLRLDKSFRQ